MPFWTNLPDILSAHFCQDFLEVKILVPGHFRCCQVTGTLVSAPLSPVIGLTIKLEEYHEAISTSEMFIWEHILMA